MPDAVTHSVRTLDGQVKQFTAISFMTLAEMRKAGPLVADETFMRQKAAEAVAAVQGNRKGRVK